MQTSTFRGLILRSVRASASVNGNTRARSGTKPTPAPGVADISFQWPTFTPDEREWFCSL